MAKFLLDALGVFQLDAATGKRLIVGDDGICELCRCNCCAHGRLCLTIGSGGVGVIPNVYPSGKVNLGCNEYYGELVPQWFSGAQQQLTHFCGNCTITPECNSGWGLVNLPTGFFESSGWYVSYNASCGIFLGLYAFYQASDNNDGSCPEYTTYTLVESGVNYGGAPTPYCPQVAPASVVLSTLANCPEGVFPGECDDVSGEDDSGGDEDSGEPSEPSSEESSEPDSEEPSEEESGETSGDESGDESGGGGGGGGSGDESGGGSDGSGGGSGPGGNTGIGPITPGTGDSPCTGCSDITWSTGPRVEWVAGGPQQGIVQSPIFEICVNGIAGISVDYHSDDILVLHPPDEPIAEYFTNYGDPSAKQLYICKPSAIFLEDTSGVIISKSLGTAPKFISDGLHGYTYPSGASISGLHAGHVVDLIPSGFKVVPLRGFIPVSALPAPDASGIVQIQFSHIVGGTGDADVRSVSCYLTQDNSTCAAIIATYVAGKEVCPTLAACSLVGQVGGTCIQLGTDLSFIAPSSGALTLLFNDAVGGYADNSGSYNVTIYNADGSTLWSGSVDSSVEAGTTGPTLVSGDSYRVIASGVVSYAGASNCYSDADGNPYPGGLPVCVQLGASVTFTATESGQFTLYLNDARASFTDNSGGFATTIATGGSTIWGGTVDATSETGTPGPYLAAGTTYTVTASGNPVYDGSGHTTDANGVNTGGASGTGGPCPGLTLLSLVAQIMPGPPAVGVGCANNIAIVFTDATGNHSATVSQTAIGMWASADGLTTLQVDPLISTQYRIDTTVVGGGSYYWHVLVAGGCPDLTASDWTREGAAGTYPQLTSLAEADG